jgi:hypothetical protein
MLPPDDDARRHAVDRVFALFVSEGVSSGSSGPSPDDPSRWSFTLDTRIRRFKDIKTLDDQILRHIETADLLVADLTDTNGNVMYEVGYADALRKAIVVINQDVASTPFDLSVHRQIEYAVWDLPDLTSKIGRFTCTALEGRAQQDAAS